ncbi:MAG: hypothetical protein ACLPOA_03115, partial [Methylocella sp.]
FDGAKGRVCRLSLNMCQRLGDHARQVTCVADGDSGRPALCALLFYTDYPDFMSYLFVPNLICDFLRFVAFIEDERELEWLYGAMRTILQSLYAYHGANIELHWRMSKVDFTASCTYGRGQQLSFDRDDYIRRYLMAGGKLGRQREFMARVGDILDRPYTDERQTIRGHDLLQLLLFVLRRATKLNLGLNEPAIRRMLMLMLSARNVSGFRRLICAMM